MRLLLDTHVILWAIASPERLPKDIAEKLEDPSTELGYSPITLWEILILILILAEKGRIELEMEAEKFIRAVLQKVPLREAPINTEVAIESRKVALPHQDPADRFITATAIVYGLTLVTADKRFMDTGGLKVIPIK